MSPNAHTRPRYSNTLLVTLNNRIYFRDHTPGHDDSAHIPKSGPGSFLTMLTSLGFARAGPQSQASPDSSFKLNTISRTTDPEKQNGDAASTTSQPVCAFPITVAIQSNASEQLSFAIRPPSECHSFPSNRDVPNSTVGG